MKRPAIAGIFGVNSTESNREQNGIVGGHENRSYEQIVGNPNAPNINRLAMTYGVASQFYAEVHPSEGNYVAMIGGDTFGIHDDDAWYCTRGNPDRYCGSQTAITPYPDHTIKARSLADQLAARRLSWKGYFESIPAPGSRAVFYPDRASPVPGVPSELYASKHNGFINFKSVQDDPELSQKFVGFDQLYADLASGSAPKQVAPAARDNGRPSQEERGDRVVISVVQNNLNRSPWMTIFIRGGVGAYEGEMHYVWPTQSTAPFCKTHPIPGVFPTGAPIRLSRQTGLSSHRRFGSLPRLYCTDTVTTLDPGLRRPRLGF